ncbi:DUF3265 domain-containing protein [Vibrio cholerae]|nr:DUF3265 domain-containing protein [Vibrio cholerae]
MPTVWQIKKYGTSSTILSLLDVGNKFLTRHLRGIHAAWHFWYAVNLGGESAMRKVDLCGTHPLMRR